jgi:hypothetical protein
VLEAQVEREVLEVAQEQWEERVQAMSSVVYPKTLQPTDQWHRTRIQTEKIPV